MASSASLASSYSYEANAVRRAPASEMSYNERESVFHLDINDCAVFPEGLIEVLLPCSFVKFRNEDLGSSLSFF